MVPPELTDIQRNLLHEAARQGRMPVKAIAFPVKKLVKLKYGQLVKRQGGGFDLVLTAAGRERELAERKRAEEKRLRAGAVGRPRHVGLPAHVKEGRERGEAARLRKEVGNV